MRAPELQGSCHGQQDFSLCLLSCMAHHVSAVKQGQSSVYLGGRNGVAELTSNVLTEGSVGRLSLWPARLYGVAGEEKVNYLSLSPPVYAVR